jgi:hypothetical protein
MLYSSSSFCAKTIEAQTVAGWIDFRYQPSAQDRPLCRIDFALENGILHTLAEIEASPRHSSQPPTAGAGFGVHVIGDEH